MKTVGMIFKLPSIILVFVLATISCGSIYAQDTLYKVNHEKLIVKVQQVGPTDVIYHLSTELDGRMYTIPMDEVWKIVYPDGHVDLFNEENGVTRDTLTIYQRPYVVEMNLVDLVGKDLTVQFESHIGNTGLWIRVPISIGFNTMIGKEPTTYFSGSPAMTAFYNANKTISTGLHLNFSPNYSEKKYSYYMGLYSEVGETRYLNYPFMHFQQDPLPPTYLTGSFAGAGITQGVLIKPIDRMSVEIEFNGGMMKSSTHSNAVPLVRFEMNIGYRFGKKGAF